MVLCSCPIVHLYLSQTGGDESASNSGSRRSSAIDDRRPSLRRVDQENLLKVRRDSKSHRPSLADVIPDWPSLQKVKRPEKVNTICFMKSSSYICIYMYQYQHLNCLREWTQIDKILIFDSNA